MKKKIIAVISLLSLASLSFGLALSVSSKDGGEETKAYSGSSLPTTINLNDATDSTIRSYYSSLNSLGTSERQGTNLLGHLKTILKNGQQYYSYESGTNIWKMYEITDRDWVLSPASSISGYNSNTNTITGYTYGSSLSNKGTNPYVHALYNNRNVTNQARAWDSHGERSNAWTIEREHVWPKSQGFDSEGAGGARGDPMHLMAANGTANGDHSNHPYGYVDKTKTYKDDGNTHSNITGNLTGKSKTLGGSGTVFEPQDSDKGDIARSIFYMAARYNKYDGETSFDTNDPNLGLVNQVVEKSSYTTTTASTVGEMGILQDLLEWNRLDPPDEFEIHRNNLLHTNFTSNRNPFIDFPEWAEYIWGKSVDGSYSSSSTGYATPSSDNINTFSGGVIPPTPTPTVNSVTISPNSLNLDLHNHATDTLTATVSVSDGAPQTVNWSSSNTSVATVSSSGAVIGKSVGTATITARSTYDNTKYGTCTVTVVDSTPSGGDTPDGDASLYSGALTEGDYVIVYGTKAMKNTVSSNRFEYSEVTITDNAISQPNANLIWHIAPSEDYWTIYNSSVSKYAAGTGTKNQGTLLGSVTDYAKWTVSGTSTYEFVNLGNTSASVNARLRNNGTYGFACYSDQTGGALSLYKVEEAAPTATSITATVDKTFKVGETITKSDVTVIDDLDNLITDFTFSGNNYQFKYSDASSGGNLTNKVFDVTYGDLETTVTVQVQREEYVEPYSTTKVLDGFDSENVSGTKNSEATNNIIIQDGITYTASATYLYSGQYLSFKTTKVPDSNPSVYYTDSVLRNITKFDTAIESVELVLVGTRKPTIDATIEYSYDGQEESDWSTTPGFNSYYFRIRYIGSFTGYVNVESVTVTLGGSETAETVSNYIMFEDTNNQCETKLDYAIKYFYNMSTSERSTFMSSNDYVIKTARERLNAWLVNQGKQIEEDNGDYIISPLRFTNPIHSENSGALIAIILSTSISLIAVSAFLIKRKKHH